MRATGRHCRQPDAVPDGESTRPAGLATADAQTEAGASPHYPQSRGSPGHGACYESLTAGAGGAPPAAQERPPSPAGARKTRAVTDVGGRCTVSRPSTISRPAPVCR